MPKTAQLQIRISPSEKATLKRLAGEAGVSVSEYVLSKALPTLRVEFEAAVNGLPGASDRGRALEELARLLADLPDADFAEATGGAAPRHLPPVLQNYAAALVEREAARRGVAAPEWTREVEPLTRPHFAQDLRSLRPHLMRVTPPTFKVRRVFVAAPGDPRR